MPVFTYKIRDESGGLCVDKIEAGSVEAALLLLKNNDIFPIEIKKESLLNKDILDLNLQQNTTLSDISVFCTGLSFLLSSGVPISSAIETLQHINNGNKKMSSCLKKIYLDIQKGSKLSESMCKHKIFPKTLVEMIKVGEDIGKVSSLVENLSYHYDKENQFRKNIKSMLIYPTVMVILMFGVLAVSMFVVIPKYMSMLDSFDAKLPSITLVFVHISNFITNNYIFIILFTIISYLLFAKCLKSTKGKQFWDYFLYKIPVLNKIIESSHNARFTRLFAMLLNSGIKTITSLELLVDVNDNFVIKNSLKRIIVKIQQGHNVFDAFNEENYFNPMFKAMFKVGIGSGNLPLAMEETAGFLEKDLDLRLINLQSVINIAITMLMGIFVLLIVMAIVLPTYELINVT